MESLSGAHKMNYTMRPLSPEKDKGGEKEERTGREKKDRGKGRRERREGQEGRYFPTASVLWLRRQNQPSKHACMLTDEEGLGASPRHTTILRRAWKTGFQLGT